MSAKPPSHLKIRTISREREWPLLLLEDIRFDARLIEGKMIETDALILMGLDEFAKKRKL